jgi:exonuclease III
MVSMKDKENIKFLFWNINNKNLKNNIINIVKSSDIDIIILLESKIDSIQFINDLKINGLQFYENKSVIPQSRIKIFSKFKNDEFKPFQDLNEKITIRKLKIKENKEILIAIVHLISKREFKNLEQYQEATRYYQEIINAEKNSENDNTIVIGDFNMNPFEEGMIMTNCFNAVMSKEIAMKGSKKVQGKDYKYFYNPMWNLFGDNKDEPFGTYYYNSSGHINYYWNIFDQVLLRPNLIQNFNHDSLKILNSDGIASLLNKSGIPNKSDLSDHLPVLFSITLGG